MTDDEIYELCWPYLVTENYTFGEIAELTGLDCRDMIDVCIRSFDRTHAEIKELTNEIA